MPAIPRPTSWWISGTNSRATRIWRCASHRSRHLSPRLRQTASRSRRARSALPNRGTSRCLCATPTATSSNCAGASRARSRASLATCRKPAARTRRRGLLHQRGVDAVPIGRRRRRLEIGDALLVELIDVLHDLRRLGAARFELAVRGLPILAAIGVDHRIMRAFEGGEGRRGPYAVVTEQEEDADRRGLADDQNEVDLEHRLAENYPARVQGNMLI